MKYDIRIATIMITGIAIKYFFNAIQLNFVCCRLLLRFM
jgi:hypothetical protein